LGLLDETIGDEGHLEVVFIGDVLVERRGTNAEGVGDRSHGETGGSVSFEERTGNLDDLVTSRHDHLRPSTAYAKRAQRVPV
jgi:hypothetical protein